MASLAIRIELTALRCLLLLPRHESAQLCRGVCSFFFNLREPCPACHCPAHTGQHSYLNANHLSDIAICIRLLPPFNYGNLSFLYLLPLDYLYVSMSSILISISTGQRMAVDNATIEPTHIYKSQACSIPVCVTLLCLLKKFW